ncbi:MAG: flippase-like domain-containing protein [Desulfobacterales bacterium]|nr:flippase-like domain-containing protein [Desulfobacterales bacterium]
MGENLIKPNVRPFIVVKWVLFTVFISMLVFYIKRYQHEFSFILSIKYRKLIPIFLLQLASIILSGLRFYLVLASVGAKISFLTFLKHYNIGRFLPHGGNVYQAVMLKKSNSVGYGSFVSGVLSVKWMGIIFTMFLGTFIIAAFDPGIQIGRTSVLLLLISLLAFQILLIPILHFLYGYLTASNWMHRLPMLLIKLTEVIQRIIDIAKNPLLLFKCFIIIVLNKCIGILILYFLFRSIGENVNIAELAIYNICLELTTVITLSPSNIGVREFFLGYLSLFMGTGFAQGVTVSMLARLIKFVIQGVLSIFYIMFDKDKITVSTPEGLESEKSI